MVTASIVIVDVCSMTLALQVSISIGEITVLLQSLHLIHMLTPAAPG